jgi:hypothetical protein
MDSEQGEKPYKNLEHHLTVKPFTVVVAVLPDPEQFLDSGHQIRHLTASLT